MRDGTCPSCRQAVFASSDSPGIHLLATKGPDTDMPTPQRFLNSRTGTIVTYTKDLRPLIDRNDTNGLSQAERVRDEIYDRFARAAADKKVNVLVLKSPPFTAPPWVKVESWIRHPSDHAITLRASAIVTIRPREFHRFPTEIDMEITNDKRSRTWRSITAFSNTNAARVLEYLLFERTSHAFGLTRCQTWPFQFWRPRNKPARLGADPMRTIVTALFVFGFVTLTFGIGVLLILVGAAVAYLSAKRPRHVLSAGKPAQEPRRLIRLDSWQALVKEIGSERDAVKNAIQGELAKVAEDSFVIEPERIWYWGVDGVEEREQMVIRFRRGLAFVHVYKYGSDLYVGWDAHVNCGTWVEQTSGGGYEKRNCQLCAVHTIVAGWHVPNEYDITDTNCLLERVHAAVTKVIKHKLADHKIDQEIDFKILREQRQNVVGRQDTESGGAIQGVLSRFRRVG